MIKIELTDEEFAALCGWADAVMRAAGVHSMENGGYTLFGKILAAQEEKETE